MQYFFMHVFLLLFVLTSLGEARQIREADDDPLIVKINKGKVKGVTLLSGHGKEVDAFLGIPYAKPPVGQLR